MQRGNKIIIVLGSLSALLALALAAALYFAFNSGIGQIAVAGESSMEIEPDEIVLSLRLSEYYAEERNGANDPALYRTLGPSISEIETAALQALQEAGLAADAVTLQEAGMQTPYYGANAPKRPLAYRDYLISTAGFAETDKILAVKMPYKTANFAIQELKNAQLDSYKLQNKQQALANARVKANALAEGYGKVAGLVFASEGESRITSRQGLDDSYAAPKARAAAFNAAAISDEAAAGAQAKPNVALRKISISSRVDAVFAVKR